MDYQTFVDWIQGEYIDKVVLLDVGYYDVEAGSEKTLFLSTEEYTTSESDIPKLTPYSSVVRGGISFSKQLNINRSGPSFSWGTITISNSEGWMDNLIRTPSGNYNIFKNRLVDIYIGDVSWPKSDFVRVLSVLIDDIDIRSVDEVIIRFKDSMQLLNQAVNIETVTNAPRTLNDLYKDLHAGANIPSGNPRYQDRENPLPFCLGECFNIQPFNVDWVYTDNTVSGNYFMIHDGPIQSVLAVRDNGGTLPTDAYEVIHSDGVLRMLTPAYGNLTCDVQGAKFPDTIKVNVATEQVDELLGQTLYLDDPLNISLNLISHYGIIQNRMSVQNFDAQSLVDLVKSANYSDMSGTTNLTRIGYYTNSSANILSICNDLLSSISCQMLLNNSGLLTVVEITTPELSTKAISSTITLADIELGGVSIKDVIAPTTNVEKLAYARNYNPNAELVFSISGLEKDILLREYLEISSNLVAGVDPQYKLPNQKSTSSPTYLIETNRAQQEANRRASMLCRRSIILDIRMTPKAYPIELGDKVTLQYYRFNLTNATGIVIGKNQDITSNSYTITLLI